MRILLPLLTFLLLINMAGFNLWSAMGVAIWVAYVVHFFQQLNSSIAFREYILMMYGLNYLFSPALTYEVTQNIAIYKMRLNPETYFSIAIPAMLCLHAGLFLLRSKIFTFRFYTDRVQTLVNERLLKAWLIGGTALSIVPASLLPGDVGFMVYLLSGVRYVAAFSLFVIDRKKYKWFLFGLLAMDVLSSLRAGMFHDTVVWILFFSMVWTYIMKPGTSKKFVLGSVAIVGLFVLQSVKGLYREQLRAGTEGGFSTFSSAFSKGSNTKEGIFNMKSLALSLTRANQGWIFSSAMQKSDRTKNFQQMNLVKIYAEAAFLPRALAPNKLEAGDTKIFNQFSGIRILKGTSMGLGLFADGYISYGYFGTLIFAFVFGLICALVFKLVERWSAASPYFVFFIFPLLNFAVRADCETQTWMGHIVKGVVVFSIVMYYLRRYLQRRSLAVQQETEETPAAEEAFAGSPQLAS